jgi:hypothetical protein
MEDQLMRFRSVLLATMLFLAACAAPSSTSGARPSEPGGEGITGTFNGNATLEGGCAWVDTGGTRYQLALPQGYRVEYEQLTIVGPDGKPVATAGDTITVTGHMAEEQLSFCQIGPIFDVETIRAGS